jgi:hypothetical protein
MNKVKPEYITEITVLDGEATLEIYRDPESGGFFGIDASFIDQVDNKIPSPFNPDTFFILPDPEDL